MDQTIAQRLFAAYEQAGQDPEYQQLLTEHRKLEQRLLAQLDTMDAQQRDAVLDYLGLAGEMHRKLLEFSCKERLREGH